MKTTILTILTCAFSASLASAEPDKPKDDQAVKPALKSITPIQEWRGGFPNQADEPLMQEAPQCGYIASQAAWAKLWKAWRREEPLPKVDFSKELIMVGVTDCSGNKFDPSFWLDEEGVLSGRFWPTKMGGPGFAYVILLIDRKGIKTYKGKSIDTGIDANANAAPLLNPNPAFGAQLYQQLRSEDGNVFFSPYSISEAMGMAYAGAGGNTATEIAKALGFDKDTKALGPQMHAFRSHLMGLVNKEDNKLNIANALCVTGLDPLPAYQDTVRKHYEGEIFTGGLDEINGWVKTKTEGNIEKILEELSPDSACVLLNAVYFKGNWKTPFKAGNTGKADFHLSPDKAVSVVTMSRSDSFQVLRDNNLIAVEMPYQTSASMVLIMPDKAEGMKELQDKLSEAMIQDLCQRLKGGKGEYIKLFMPKFRIATSYDLIPQMKQLGIADAFDFDKADFKAMYGETPVKISQIKHKATLEVDEMGSVASAATAVEMQFYSAPPPAIRFDRPFLVLIRESSTGTNLFMGRINDPTAK